MLRSVICSKLTNFLAIVTVCLPLTAANVQQLHGTYRATAYNTSGITASGEWTHRHVVAADPDLLPIGSRIKIRRAGKYSGEYVVADTGAKIQGRRLDIYMPGEATCKKFGTRLVKVKVISLGDGTHEAAKQADQVVKTDVVKDINKNVVGNAATEEDWVKARKQGTAPKPDQQ
ncbi:MAG: 3D domain-containing protein [Acidobacteriaceae bacterium]|nr:3D domain-containing protein [Acidobacteriaceae bacterium]